jgi:hypothetical protein
MLILRSSLAFNPATVVLLLVLSVASIPDASSFRGAEHHRHHRRPCHYSSTNFRHSSLITTLALAEVNAGRRQSPEGMFDVFPDRFDRWRFLQNVLDGDASSDLVNQVLYEVLDGALKFPRLDGDGETIVLPGEYRDRIQDVLDNHSSDGRIPAMCTSDAEDDDGEIKVHAAAMLTLLEGLLPDTDEDEDASKSLWDTVMEIHGREAVKYQETKNRTMEWKLASVVTRLLLHFDFLTLGIVKSPVLN